jgi:hypothetical protein
VFRDKFQALMAESYEAALQARIDAHPTAQQAAFSPSEPCGDRCSCSAQQGPAPR